MRKYPIYHIDTFTHQMFKGNPTVSVLHADTLTETEMKLLARELNFLSETGFVLKSEKADFRLRYFSAAGDEIKFCGHATVGALYALAKEGLLGSLKLQGKKLLIETQIGLLEMEVKWDESFKDLEIQFNLPKIEMKEAPYDHKELCHALGISIDLIDKTKPLMIEETNHYLYFAVSSLEKLQQLKLDLQKTIQFVQKENFVILCALTPHAFDIKNDVHARGFAPLVGIFEDPFTGSMQGGIVGYLFQNNMIDRNTKTIRTEQGHFINRPGVATLEVLSHAPLRIRIHAAAALVFSSEIKLP